MNYTQIGSNMDHNQLKDLLSNYYGTEQWFRHSLNRNMLYTEGVRAFAEHAGGGAYWFLDICATEVWALTKQEEFLSICLKVGNDKAVITVEDGNDNVLLTRKVDYTDCPLGEWRFYLTDHVLLLPSEY